MGDLDPNVWYQLTESRVDFNSSLQVAGTGLVMAAAGNKTNQFWQILPLGNNRFVFRNKANGIDKQLATCYAASEKDPSHTQPCMLDSVGDESQQWTITTWLDGAYRIVNLGNGTGYNLDCHPGNPLFMSSITAGAPRQPAQHWLASSLLPIDDGAYSTTITSSPSSTSGSVGTTTPASATTTGSAVPANSASASPSASSSKPSSLSQGAAAGIGIATGLLVCLVAAAILFFFIRRRRRARNIPELDGGGAVHEIDYKHAQGPAHEMFHPPAELAGTAYELPATAYELTRAEQARSTQAATATRNNSGREAT